MRFSELTHIKSKGQYKDTLYDAKIVSGGLRNVQTKDDILKLSSKRRSSKFSGLPSTDNDVMGISQY